MSADQIYLLLLVFGGLTVVAIGLSLISDSKAFNAFRVLLCLVTIGAALTVGNIAGILGFMGVCALEVYRITLKKN